jgi:hypothetical protein
VNHGELARQVFDSPDPAYGLATDQLKITVVHGSVNHMFSKLHNVRWAAYPEMASVEDMGTYRFFCSRHDGPATPGNSGCPVPVPAGMSPYLAKGQRGGATRNNERSGPPSVIVHCRTEAPPQLAAAIAFPLLPPPPGSDLAPAVRDIKKAAPPALGSGWRHSLAPPPPGG